MLREKVNMYFPSNRTKLDDLGIRSKPRCFCIEHTNDRSIIDYSKSFFKLSLIHILGERVFFPGEMQRGRFVLALATAGSLTGNQCLVREVPLFCAMANYLHRSSDPSEAGRVENEQVPRTRHRLRKEPACSKSHRQTEIPMPLSLLIKTPQPAGSSSGCRKKARPREILLTPL